jgi:hypothetical protein
MNTSSKPYSPPNQTSTIRSSSDTIADTARDAVDAVRLVTLLTAVKLPFRMQAIGPANWQEQRRGR